MADASVKNRTRTEKAAKQQPDQTDAAIQERVGAEPAVATVIEQDRPAGGIGSGRGRFKAKPVGPRKKSPRKTSVMDRRGDLSSIKGRITTRRCELGYDQETAAAKSGVARAAYSQYETGKVTPSVVMLDRLAETLDVTPQWLTYGIVQNDEVEYLRYEPAAKSWVREDTGCPPKKWLQTRAPGVALRSLAYVEVPNESSTGLQPGDLAIVHREDRPSDQHQEFIFVIGKVVSIAYLRRVGGEIEIDWGGKVDTVSLRSIMVLGRVIGSENVDG